MPVLIAAEDLDEWLSREPLAPGELDRLVRPAPPEALDGFRVSTLVNDAREEGPELVEPVAEGAGDRRQSGPKGGDAETGRDAQLF